MEIFLPSRLLYDVSVSILSLRTQLDNASLKCSPPMISSPGNCPDHYKHLAVVTGHNVADITLSAPGREFLNMLESRNTLRYSCLSRKGGE